MRHNFWLIHHGWLIFILFGMHSQAHASELVPDLFPGPGAAPLQLTLELPLRAVLKGKSPRSGSQGDDHKPVQHAARLTIGEHQLPIKLARRGKSRQMHCSFPPLWLDFKKKTTTGTPFAGQNKLKLVTHCKNSFAKRGYLAAEMLAYEFLNLFTEHSFRTRAVRINYIDRQVARDSGQPVETGSKAGEIHWGFLIEHKSGLARRVGAAADKHSRVAIDDLAADYSALVAVHQYLIANTDFSFTQGPPGDNCCHNVVPLNENVNAAGTKASIFPVPYDFDASGLVNPPYAAPVPSLKISKVTQRVYRGYCRHNAEVASVLAQFTDRKQDLYSHVEQFDSLPHLQTKRINKLLDRFYAVIQSPAQVEKKILAKCR